MNQELVRLRKKIIFNSDANQIMFKCKFLFATSGYIRFLQKGTPLKQQRYGMGKVNNTTSQENHNIEILH